MDIDLARILLPDTPVLEIVVRGTLVYLALLLLLRLARRQAGAISTADVLLLVLIADAAQGAMAGDTTSVADGVLLVATILGWSYAIDWLGYRYGRVGRFLHPPPTPLIANGRINQRVLRHELLTREELMSELRTQGVERIADVKRAYVEGDGQVTVIRARGDSEAKDTRPSGAEPA
jgi:uncharacterized membrane protein YcaP (DUF421 family)